MIIVLREDYDSWGRTQRDPLITETIEREDDELWIWNSNYVSFVYRKEILISPSQRFVYVRSLLAWNASIPTIHLGNRKQDTIDIASCLFMNKNTIFSFNLWLNIRQSWSIDKLLWIICRMKDKESKDMSISLVDFRMLHLVLSSIN